MYFIWTFMKPLQWTIQRQNVSFQPKAKEIVTSFGTQRSTMKIETNRINWNVYTEIYHENRNK